MRFVLVSKWLCRVRKKEIKQANMDLNEPPSAEFDYDFLQESDGNPTYCTQTTAVHNIEPSPNQQNPVVINGAAADDVNLGAAGNNLTEDVPTNSQDVEVVEEIWSTPPVSYTGQMFDTKQEACAFYNSYANRIGFVGAYQRHHWRSAMASADVNGVVGKSWATNKSVSARSTTVVFYPRVTRGVIYIYAGKAAVYRI